ncbi:hypothetical protein AGLY_012353 [Aphis glycines]|uniref:Uncharacterized protein n=1 Tax=Aphis glycines TaxID=307491 RepID=A0A6G0TBZ4_APHGL|nr:hypothetical protein AGLY_012353 [Aphis glycines]
MRPTHEKPKKIVSTFIKKLKQRIFKMPINKFCKENDAHSIFSYNDSRFLKRNLWKLCVEFSTTKLLANYHDFDIFRKHLYFESLYKKKSVVLKTLKNFVCLEIAQKKKKKTRIFWKFNLKITKLKLYLKNEVKKAEIRRSNQLFYNELLTNYSWTELDYGIKTYIRLRTQCISKKGNINNHFLLSHSMKHLLNLKKSKIEMI